MTDQKNWSGLLHGCAGPNLQLVTGLRGPERSLCLPEYLIFADKSIIRDSFGCFKVIPLVETQILLGQEQKNTLSYSSLSHFGLKELIRAASESRFDKERGSHGGTG